MPFEAAGFAASVAHPYPQALGWCEGGLFAAATGGGGGAAQLFPASELAALLAASPKKQLQALFEALDEAIEPLVDRRWESRYRASSAQLSAALADEDRLWVGNVGLGRAWLTYAHGFIQLTRDDSLAEAQRDAGAPVEERYAEVATALLNGERTRERRDGLTVVRPPVRLVTPRPGEGVLLATRGAHRQASPGRLEALTREALRGAALAPGVEALWRALREETDEPAQFDRTAAVVLVRPR